MDTINATSERIVLCFDVESVQAHTDPHDGIAKIVERMRTDLLGHPMYGEMMLTHLPRDGLRFYPP